jgi:hypothetical protein
LLISSQEANMSQQSDATPPHGDPLKDAAAEGREDNRAQRDSDAAPDATAEPSGALIEDSDREGGRGSDANGVPAFDDADGKRRRKLYDDGADLVSRID